MQEVGYTSWGLIPIDTDPATEGVQATNPPMLTTVALDQNSSLVFQLVSSPAQLLIKVGVTTMSAERSGPGIFRVLTGTTGSDFHPLQSSEWENTPEGMHTLFSAKVRGVESHLKLLYTEDSTLVVTQIQFLTEA